MRGLKTDHGARIIIAGHAFIQNIHRGRAIDQFGQVIDVYVSLRRAEAVMQSWLDFLTATNNDKAALAAFLRGHRPVIRNWDRITVPTVVAAGVDDATAAPIADVVARLPYGRSLSLPGDHFTAVAAPAFTDAIVELARCY